MGTSSHTPGSRRAGRSSSSLMWLFALGFVVGTILIFLVPAPYSLYLLGALVLGSIILGVYFWTRLRVPDASPTELPGDEMIAAPPESAVQPSAAPQSILPTDTVLALIGFALMIAAAFDLRPANDQTLLFPGSLKMIAGALAVGLAIRESGRLPALSRPLDVPFGGLRRSGWAFAGVGTLLIAIVTEINGQVLHIPALAEVRSSVQLVMLTCGILLVGYGFGGAPTLRLRLPRIRWKPLLPLGAILSLALFLRVWDLGGTLPYLLDELHWSDAIIAVEIRPNLQILTPMSAQSPYTWIFPYWQAIAVHFLGHTFEGLRFVSAIVGVLTVLVIYLLARELFDRKTALLAALILATFPPHVHFSRTAIVQIADPLFGALALLFLVRALRNNRPIEWAFAGVSLGMTQYFYEGARLLFPPLIIAFVILLALRGQMRGKWRGFAILLVTAFIVGAPIYYTLIGSGKPLFGRFDDSGLGASYWQQFEAAGITANSVFNQVGHTLSAFMIFGAQADRGVYYGGGQALVLDYLLPFFLFGCFYLMWRYPSMAFVVPLWIVATGLGNGLLRNTLVSSRYEEVLPALALALAAGVRYLLAFILPETRPDSEGVMRRESRLRRSIPVVVVGAMALLQVGYYFGPHLQLLNVQVRDEKAYRDGIDAVNRAVDLPGNTQIYLIGKPVHDQIVPRDWLGFLSRDGDPTRYFPLLAVPPDTISVKYLNDLPRGVNYAFYVDPKLRDTMRLLSRYFAGISPAMYSLSNVPAHKEYVLFYVPSQTLPPHVDLEPSRARP